ncbi:MAG: ribbon-helix-helix domain-containing protein [Alphaproteobacteria bacterium]|nr:ribbon-helix-helix domain-containing protein [Alphaproteobacteria bacterium]MDX5369520.1 ribbon-helix-helix domain-containing protein [Alphaproteobacteria bacterium]MDX5464178.1 ribbon-helix-helix domain-containing protein [Alphaproteobacteria bacterium]
MSRPVKRSVSIAGHRTSVALEPEFWEAVDALCAREEMSLASFVARIDGARVRDGSDTGLAGALRLHVLRAARRGDIPSAD